MKKSLKITIFFSILFSILIACSKKSDNDDDEQKFHRAQELFSKYDFAAAIPILEELKKSEIDKKILFNYLAQAYLGSTNFDLLEASPHFFTKNGERITSKNLSNEEMILVPKSILDMIPSVNDHNESRFASASQLYDELVVIYPDDPMVHSRRFLFKILYLFYLVKDFSLQVESFIHSPTLREKFELFLSIRNQKIITKTEALIFDVVEIIPNATKRFKKIAKKIVKNGIFKFRFKDRVFILDFNDSSRQVIDKLIKDFYDFFMENYLAHLDIPELSEAHFEELKLIIKEIIAGEKTVQDAVKAIYRSPRFIKLSKKYPSLEEEVGALHDKVAIENILKELDKIKVPSSEALKPQKKFLEENQREDSKPENIKDISIQDGDISIQDGDISIQDGSKLESEISDPTISIHKDTSSHENTPNDSISPEEMSIDNIQIPREDTSIENMDEQKVDFDIRSDEARDFELDDEHLNPENR